MDHLSPSSMSLFRECPRKFYYRKIIDSPHLEPKYKEAMEMGKLIHGIIEEYYNQIEDNVLTENEIYLKLSNSIDIGGFEVSDEDKVLNNLSGFVEFEQWRQQENMDLIATEKTFRDGILLGRVDALFDKGVKVVVDFKTGYNMNVSDRIVLQGEVYRRLTGADKVIIAYTIWNRRKEIKPRNDDWLDEVIEDIQSKIKKKQFERKRGEQCQNCEYSPYCYFDEHNLSVFDI